MITELTIAYIQKNRRKMPVKEIAKVVGIGEKTCERIANARKLRPTIVRYFDIDRYYKTTISL